MIQKILIANRGEVALRVERACRELGIASVAVYSEADADSLHVRLADESVCIGPPKSRESYLNIPRIMSAAQITNADAIHPGYGFLAENGQFAEACESSGIVFVGPSSHAIRQMGDKAVAKSLMRDAGVPVVPGSQGIVESAEEASTLAAEIGFPVILKAKDGGGGKGMRVVRAAEDLERLYTTAQTEAQAAFNSGALYLEKFVQRPRHIEIQLVGDKLRQCPLPGRAGLFDPTAAPEADRGGAEPRGQPGAAGADGADGGHGSATDRLLEPRHDGVSLRRGFGSLLLHGNEHPAAGRAPRYGDGDRSRSREAPDPDRRGRGSSRSARRTS